jgi:hypothetical protein
MCFVAEIRILYVYLEDVSGSLASNSRRKRFVARVDCLFSTHIHRLAPIGAREMGAYARWRISERSFQQGKMVVIYD